MERISDEAQRNGDKVLEGECRRLRADIGVWFARAMTMSIAFVCIVLVVSECKRNDDIDLLTSQLRSLNHLRFDTETQLRKCTDAHLALQLSCDVLATAANQCDCEPLPQTLPSIDVVGHRHSRKIYP